jgi:hypothetical protein
MTEFKLTIRTNPIETDNGMSSETVLFIGTHQQCLDEMKIRVRETHKVIAMLSLTIEITDPVLSENSECKDVTRQRVVVNHNYGNETHALFAVAPYVSAI